MGTRSWRVGFLLVLMAAIGGELSTTQAVVSNANWLGGAGDYSTAASWSSGAVPNNGVTNWIVNILPAGSTVTGDVSVTINALNINAGDELLIQNSTDFILNNGAGTSTISNQGTILVSALVNGTYLQTANGTVLAGGGVVNLGTNANGYFEGTRSD